MMRQNRMEFDEETEKWFQAHPNHPTTVCKCEKCSFYYKPRLGYKCKVSLELLEE